MTLSENSLLLYIDNFYALKGELSSLWGEIDRSFLLKEKNEKTWVVKYSEDKSQEEMIADQLDLLSFLETKKLSILTPKILPSKSSDLFKKIEDKGLLRVFSYIEGKLFFESLPHSYSLLELCGRRLGELDRHIALFEKQPKNRILKWDLRQCLWMKPFLPAIKDESLKKIITKNVELFAQRQSFYEEHLRQTWIHNDVNDYNLIIDGSHIGLIDFGDLIHSYHIANLAIALTYLCMDAKDILLSMASLVVGYTKENKVGNNEIEALFLFIKIRLSISLVVSEVEAEKKPDDPYVLVSRQGAIRMLKYLDDMEEEFFNNYIKDAINGPLEKQISLKRSFYFSPALTTSYTDPLAISRGKGAYLYDQNGTEYLDCVNNVSHVGHSHPRIKSAALEQLDQVNTNTRYLSDSLCAYGEKLSSYFPGLDTCFFVSSGSEANELALWLARVHTQKKWDAVIHKAYHGHTQKLIRRSSYKKNPYSKDEDPVFFFSCPDRFRLSDEKILNHLEDELTKLFQETDEKGLSAFLCESMMSCAGQLLYPKDYLQKIVSRIQSTGALCIVDEIQTGLGRVGNVFSNYINEGIQPDIVTLGKPLGNGFPLAAVLTRREIGESFASNGFEFFSSFGGSNLSAKIGLEVCQIIEEEDLQKNALETGNFLLQELKDLQKSYPILADIRGRGLFIGIELTDAKKEPLPKETVKRFVEQMKQKKVLLSQDGMYQNVIKIKPPLVFGKKEAVRLLENLNSVLLSY